MSQLPRDPLQPASNRQLIAAGFIFAFAGAGFASFAVWLLSIAHANGRLGTLPVTLLTAFMSVLAVGLFDAAVAVFKKQKNRRKHLLSTPALWVIGGLLILFPICFLVFGHIVRPELGLAPALRSAPLLAFGVAAIALARLRVGKESS
jgi:hypothetical protein